MEDGHSVRHGTHRSLDVPSCTETSVLQLSLVLTDWGKSTHTKISAEVCMTNIVFSVISLSTPIQSGLHEINRLTNSFVQLG